MNGGAKLIFVAMLGMWSTMLEASCPSLFAELSGTQRCFHVSTVLLSHTDAMQYCFAMQSTLATIDDIQVGLLGKSLQQVTNPGKILFWHGLNDIREEGVNRWQDGSPLIWTSWDPILPSQPNGGGVQNCWGGNASQVNGEWQDRECLEKNNVMCELHQDTARAASFSKMLPSGNERFWNRALIVGPMTRPKHRCGQMCLTNLMCDTFAYKANSCILLSTIEVDPSAKQSMQDLLSGYDIHERTK